MIYLLCFLILLIPGVLDTLIAISVGLFTLALIFVTFSGILGILAYSAGLFR